MQERKTSTMIGKENTFVKTGNRLLESNGIKEQIIVDVLQSVENVCGAAEVANHWQQSIKK
eukprot:7776727-Ditylum_brightwellii.AAC.1